MVRRTARIEGSADAPDTNPYSFQDHLYDKTRPENIGFLKRFRSLLNQYSDRAAVGEVGDGAGAGELLLHLGIDALARRHVERRAGGVELGVQGRVGIFEDVGRPARAEGPVAPDRDSSPRAGSSPAVPGASSAGG